MSRSELAMALVLLSAAAVALVVGLAVVFGRDDSGPSRGATSTFGFDAAGALEGGLEAVSGRVELADGRAVATAASADEPAVALVDRQSRDGRLTVVASDPAPGWGVVVRWESAERYWFVAVPDDGGALALGRVRDGRTTVLARASGPLLAAGVTVDVRYDDNRVDLRVDGDLVASARGRSVSGLGVGLRATAVGPMWDDLTVGPRPRPVVRPDG